MSVSQPLAEVAVAVARSRRCTLTTHAPPLHAAGARSAGAAHVAAARRSWRCSVLMLVSQPLAGVAVAVAEARVARPTTAAAAAQAGEPLGAAEQTAPQAPQLADVGVEVGLAAVGRVAVAVGEAAVALADAAGAGRRSRAWPLAAWRTTVPQPPQWLGARRRC